MQVSIDFTQLEIVQSGILCVYMVIFILGIKDIKGLSTTAIFYELFFITYWYRLQMQVQLAGKIETVDLIFTVIWLIGAIGSIALHEIEKSR